ncbi:hypothetical protein P4123_13220 [Pseudomonas aeruginosa]|nr:hypothetical protein [Pseudomonas aeruginosa]
MSLGIQWYNDIGEIRQRFSEQPATDGAALVHRPGVPTRRPTCWCCMPRGSSSSSSSARWRCC